MAKARYSKNKRVELIAHCRFTLHLPTSSTQPDPASRRCKLAATAVIDRVNKKFKGSTYSSVQHSTYQGYWIDESTEKPQIHLSTTAIMFVDIECSFGEEEYIKNQLDLLRQLAYVEYKRSGIEQKEIWITVSPVWIRMYTSKKRAKAPASISAP